MSTMQPKKNNGLNWRGTSDGRAKRNSQSNKLYSVQAATKAIKTDK